MHWRLSIIVLKILLPRLEVPTSYQDGEQYRAPYRIAARHSIGIFWQRSTNCQQQNDKTYMKRRAKTLDQMPKVIAAKASVLHKATAACLFFYFQRFNIAKLSMQYLFSQSIPIDFHCFQGDLDIGIG